MPVFLTCASSLGSPTAPASPQTVSQDIVPCPIVVNPLRMVALPESVPLLLSMDSLNVKQLKEQLLARRLKRVGNKAALVARLKEYLERNDTT